MTSNDSEPKNPATLGVSRELNLVETISAEGSDMEPVLTRLPRADTRSGSRYAFKHTS